MLPADFLSKYGRCVIRPITIAAGGNQSIEPDDNRYLLTFWATSGNVGIRPQEALDTSMIGFVMTTTSQPVMMSHALHGAQVNLGWNIQNTGGAAVTFVYIVGRMNKTGTQLEERYVQRNKANGKRRVDTRRSIVKSVRR